MKKKVNMFGKSVPVFVIAIFAMVLVSAALLTYFGSITGSVVVGQGLFLDGNDWDVPSQFVFENFTSLEEKTFVETHRLDNQATVDAVVQLNTVCVGLSNSCDSDITTSYNTSITDDSIDFGSRNNELVAIEPRAGLTLDELFAGNGFQYTYDILVGGSLNGAAPVMAVITIDDGRHIILYPGAGGRTGTHTLQFSDTVAHDSGGNNLVDFTVYEPDFQGGAQWSSNSEYDNWNFLKASGSSTGGDLPLTGNEGVTRIALMTQGANTGQEDQIESMLVDSKEYNFEELLEGTPFTVPAGTTLDFVINNHFSKMLMPDTYTINTTVNVA